MVGPEGLEVIYKSLNHYSKVRNPQIVTVKYTV